MGDIKKSICQIVCRNQIKGTGFYIGQGRIITAAHVVDGVLDVQACFMEYDENQYIYDCQLQEIQPDNVVVDIRAKHFISRHYLEKTVSTQVSAKKTSQMFVVKGCNGVGKTTWIDLLESWENMEVIGKYYINKYNDTMPSVYRKSEVIILINPIT